jgi:hypothetical protein
MDREEYRDELGDTTPIHSVFRKDKLYVEGDVPRHFGFVPLLGEFGGLWSVC